jgi:hypothetical protein
LVERHGFKQLTPNSPAVDAAVENHPRIELDVHGQPRDGKKAIGADELSAATIRLVPGAAWAVKILSETSTKQAQA